MSDLFLRIDAKQNVVLYRTRTNQGVFMTFMETRHLGFLLQNHSVRFPTAAEICEAGYEPAPQEFHRRVEMRGKRLVISPGLHEPDLFDVRRLKDC